MKKNKKYLFFFVIVTLLIFAGSFLPWNKKDRESVAWVNGVSVNTAFWQAVMEEKRSEIALKYPDGFQGEQAVLELKQSALEECIRRQIILQLAKREGLIEKIDYSSLLENMEQENQRRKETLEEGGIVYGIKEYSFQTYFSYLLSNLSRELLLKLENKELKTKEEELYNYYLSHPELKQKNPETSDIILWQIDPNSGLTQEEQKKILTRVRSQLNTKKNPDTVLEEQVIRTQMKVSENSRIISRSPVLKKEVFHLRKGETSQILQEGDTNFIIYCREYEESKEMEYEQLKGQLAEILCKEKLEQLIEKKWKEANIQINDLIYNKTEPFVS